MSGFSNITDHGRAAKNPLAGPAGRRRPCRQALWWPHESVATVPRSCRDIPFGICTVDVRTPFLLYLNRYLAEKLRAVDEALCGAKAGGVI